MLFVFTPTTYILLVPLIGIVLFNILEFVRQMKREMKQSSDQHPPGPTRWPIFGSIFLLGMYDVPYKAFKQLYEKYKSPIVKLKMGSLTCIAVSGLQNIKEVSVSKGSHFDSRPDFARYHKLFSGNKENSLAFSDWTDLQKARREMVIVHTIPRSLNSTFEHLNNVIKAEVTKLMIYLANGKTPIVELKQTVLFYCANIFTKYFCSKTFDWNDSEFVTMIDNFDDVFYEVNQGYLADFIPTFIRFMSGNLKKMETCSSKIRSFVDRKIVQERRENSNETKKDYLNNLINHVQTNAKPKLSWDSAFFALEDIIGGHSAVGNLLVKIFCFLVTKPHVQENAQLELDQCQTEDGDIIDLKYRKALPYTEAIILEAIRLIASPIVPHVASKDSSIGGYVVEKGTFIFLDNYNLNMSEELWYKPQDFIPERFIINGQISKPEFYLPFGTGRRACLGYKLVQYICFTILANVLKSYTLVPVPNQSYNIKIGNLATAKENFLFKFERRTIV